MAEFVNVSSQTVTAGGNVLFTDTIVNGCDLIYHRSDSGVVKLFPISGKQNTRFKVTFGGNLSVPTGGTAGTIGVALAVDGEPLDSTQANVTPAGVAEPFNVSTSTYIYVRYGCCATVSVQNTGDTSITVDNANIIITRE